MRKKLLLILLCGLAAVLLAGAAAVGFASRTMRSPEFRAQLSRLVEDATGRKLRLEGELSVTLFPWFGLKARGLSLGNDPRFGETPLLAARGISARIKVLPLFARRLSFDTVELEEAELALSMDEEGRGNWEGLAEHLRAQENATELDDSFFRKISVRGIRLVNSKASLDDRQHGHRYIATDIDLRTGRIEPGAPLPFTASCDFTWPNPGMVARVQGTGALHWSASDPGPLLTDTKVQGDIGGSFMPKSAPRAAMSATLTLERGRDLWLRDLRLKLMGADIKGELAFMDITERFHLEARLDIGEFRPQAVINAYWPGTIAQDFQGALQKAHGALNLLATVDELVFETPGLTLDAGMLKGKVRMGFDKPEPGLDFELSATQLDADALVAAFSSNATSEPLVVGDLPLDYLRRVSGAGKLSVGALRFAGVSGQASEAALQAGGGLIRAQLRPQKLQAGGVSAELAAGFGRAGAENGTQAAAAKPGGQALLGWSGSLRLEGVEAGQAAWLQRFGPSVSGRLDLRAKAEAPKAPAAASLKLSQAVRRAVGEAQATLGPAMLEWPADKAQPGAQGRQMRFSSLQGQARFAPAPAGDADWAVQVDGALTALGARPALSLDAKFGGLLRGQQGRVQVPSAGVSGKLRNWFLPKRENEALFSAKGSLDPAGQKLQISSASVQACGLSLGGAFTGAPASGGDWTLSGRLRCQEGDPRRLVNALDLRGIKTSDRRALQRLSGEADLSLTARGASFTNINAQLDETAVRGSYAVQNFDAPRQTLSLACGALDLDRYLPQPEPVRRGQREQKPAPEPLPVETLRDLALDGTLSFRAFKFKGLTTRDLRLSVGAKNGLLVAKPIGGIFYGGALSGEFTAQAVKNVMQTRLSLAFKDFQAGPFMLAWAGKEYVTGRADMFLDLGGAGATDLDVLRSLEGMAGFKIVDGSYYLSGAPEGPPAAARRPPPGATAQQPSQGQPVPARRGGTPFSQAAATLKVSQGVFRSDDFRLEGPGMVLTGRGRFSPAEDSIDLNLTASMSGKPDVPITVHGRLKDPEMDIATGALIGHAIMEILGLPLKPIKFFKDLLF